jgi:hypothetical protein
MLSATLWCLHGLVVLADYPASAVVVAADRAAASALPALPDNVKLLVLIQNDDEPHALIHTRALAMRDATHFVYLGDSVSSLSAMYRERLANQGAVTINLTRNLPARPARRIPGAIQPIDSILVSLISGD